MRISDWSSDVCSSDLRGAAPVSIDQHRHVAGEVFPGRRLCRAGGYFKHLTDFVDPNNSYAYDFSSLLGALTPAQQAIVTRNGLTTGRVSAPANTGRGVILGVEATLDLPFRALTSALDGFGVFATGNYTYSSIKFANNPIEAITLPGLSK